MSNKTGKKGAQPGLVPKLRFPEFWGTVGWEPASLREIYSFKGNNSLSRDKLNYVAGTVKNIHYGDIHTKFPSHFDITKELVPFINKPEETIVSAKDLCIEGDIIFADASEDLEGIGKCIEIIVLNGARVVSGLHTILARRIGERIALGFGGHVFKSRFVRTQIQKEAQGAKVLGISPTRLRNLRLPLPYDLTEQQKITVCLNSVDEQITAQAQKVDALKIHKKGLLQQLFPQIGETQPHLRFPEFNSSEVWQHKKISGLLYKVSDSVIVEPDSLYREIGIRSHGKGIFHKDLISGKQIGNKRVFSVVPDAFVVNIVFAWEQAVATTATAEVGMIASHRFPMYVALAGKCNVDYIKYFFFTKTGKWLLELASPGGAGRNRTLGQKEFEKLEIFLPQEVAEQRRIADCLSTIDVLITLETQKLETLETHKKGLIQQLFPTLEERKA